MSRNWVLIRGIMSESFHWWNFLPQLKERFPQDRFHTADILGNGRFNKHQTPLSLKRNIQALREQAPGDGKKILFGFSLGGALALEWAHQHHEEVAAVVLINSSLGISPFYKRMTPYSLSNILKTAFIRDLQQREENILRMTTAKAPAELIKEVANQWGPRGVEYPMKPLNFVWQLGVAAQIRKRQKPSVPVLILSSARDRVVHPDCSKKIAETWGFPLVTHPDAGHDLTLDDPQWVLDHLGQFVNSGIKA